MARPPPDTTFHKNDFPSSGLGSQEALDKLFQPQNTLNQTVRSALNGNLTFAQNMNAEIKTVQITTPPALVWTNVASFSNLWVAEGSSTPQYMKDGQGYVWVRGAIKSGTSNLAAFTLPAGYQPDSLWQFCTFGYNAGVANPVGMKVNTDGTVVPFSSTNTQVWLDGVRFPCADGSPGVLSCFPLKVATKVSRPAGVFLIGISDSNSTGSLTPAPGNLVTSLTGPKEFQITNLPGLPLNRTYNLTLLVVGG